MSVDITTGAGARGLADETLNKQAANNVEAVVRAGGDAVMPGGAQMSWLINCGAAMPDWVPALAGPSVGAMHGSSKKTNM